MRENTNGPPTLTGGILEVSERLTRAMRTDDSELLFSDSFNDYGSRKAILFLLSAFQESTEKENKVPLLLLSLLLPII